MTLYRSLVYLTGLHFDPLRMEVTGVPQQVGTFDLNVSAGNQAGTKRAQFQIIRRKVTPCSFRV